ncbi:hypothetical protein CQ12_13745 [Bradyrhizobium jicamae]|uniref:Uncharacterized protein n=1 Tax=Bradyrhizobium jicamae TaxID=280332 RepID=A0A0R3LPY9_9BRAD|nr:hypothetical protein CQ12_13745 [Bradyrhizobium jicamae]
MLAWVLLVANMPTIVCTICSAFLAYKEKPQWGWFAGLAVLAGIGGLLTLRVVHAQQLVLCHRLLRTHRRRLADGERGLQGAGLSPAVQPVMVSVKTAGPDTVWPSRAR